LRPSDRSAALPGRRACIDFRAGPAARRIASAEELRDGRRVAQVRAGVPERADQAVGRLQGPAGEAAPPLPAARRRRHQGPGQVRHPPTV